MRIATGNIGHESSTFTPIATPYEAFTESSRGFHRGAQVLEALRDTNSGCGGFIDGAEAHGFELAPLLWTFAEPSAPIQAGAWAQLKDEFLQRLEAAMPVDGALLDLHGAAVVEGIDDGEGDLLAGVRSILGPERPVIVTLDLHANISDAMARLADVLIPCDTYPHVDFRERGREAADLMVRTLRGEIRPTMAVERLPLLWAGGNATGGAVFDAIVAQAHALEAQPGVLTASVNPGFAWADIHDAGATVVVTTDGDPARARREARAYADAIFARRRHFLVDLVEFDEVLAAAARNPARPVVVADGQDNPGGGAPGDSTGMLRAFVQHGLTDALVLTICDPATVQRAQAAGHGAEVEVEIGGKSAPEQGPPLRARAVVENLCNLEFVIRGPMYTGMTQKFGPSALLRIGGVRVAAASNRLQLFSLECPRALGIEPTRLQWIGVKSSTHFRAAYDPIAGQVHRAAFPSVQSHDPRKLTYRNLRRPIFPLDPIEARPAPPR